MDWLIALIAFVACMFAMPMVLRRFKSSRKSGMGAATLAFGIAFSIFFDPAKKVSIEHVEKQKKQRAEASQGDVNEPL
ncbi:hypothetical protein [Novosphingopyxis sp. YJ-S2-01]|uniref:hypothetical protein n=1 Tax=Novosphingopyxis sp. YJ-S2-01 TaxID=2794021 RepID=UPI0018DB0016|nr:hypothetical protein [Novosphingopyxis sp. YJ-S2-01]MBH9538810.1 hypothetical protein [Novosphingopyxis sp. YJ-S2-01]